MPKPLSSDEFFNTLNQYGIEKEVADSIIESEKWDYISSILADQGVDNDTINSLRAAFNELVINKRNQKAEASRVAQATSDEDQRERKPGAWGDTPFGETLTSGGTNPSLHEALVKIVKFIYGDNASETNYTLIKKFVEDVAINDTIQDDKINDHTIRVATRLLPSRPGDVKAVADDLADIIMAVRHKDDSRDLNKSVDTRDILTNLSIFIYGDDSRVDEISDIIDEAAEKDEEEAAVYVSAVIDDIMDGRTQYDKDRAAKTILKLARHLSDGEEIDVEELKNATEYNVIEVDGLQSLIQALSNKKIILYGMQPESELEIDDDGGVDDKARQELLDKHNMLRRKLDNDNYSLELLKKTGPGAPNYQNEIIKIQTSIQNTRKEIADVKRKLGELPRAASGTAKLRSSKPEETAKKYDDTVGTVNPMVGEWVYSTKTQSELGTDSFLDKLYTERAAIKDEITSIKSRAKLTDGDRTRIKELEEKFDEISNRITSAQSEEEVRSAVDVVIYDKSTDTHWRLMPGGKVEQTAPPKASRMRGGRIPGAAQDMRYRGAMREGAYMLNTAYKDNVMVRLLARVTRNNEALANKIATILSTNMGGVVDVDQPSGDPDTELDPVQSGFGRVKWSGNDNFSLLLPELDIETSSNELVKYLSSDLKKEAGALQLPLSTAKKALDAAQPGTSEHEKRQREYNKIYAKYTNLMHAKPSDAYIYGANVPGVDTSVPDSGAYMTIRLSGEMAAEGFRVSGSEGYLSSPSLFHEIIGRKPGDIFPIPIYEFTDDDYAIRNDVLGLHDKINTAHRAFLEDLRREFENYIRTTPRNKRSIDIRSHGEPSQRLDKGTKAYLKAQDKEDSIAIPSANLDELLDNDKVRDIISGSSDGVIRAEMAEKLLDRLRPEIEYRGQLRPAIANAAANGTIGVEPFESHAVNTLADSLQHELPIIRANLTKIWGEPSADSKRLAFDPGNKVDQLGRRTRIPEDRKEQLLQQRLDSIDNILKIIKNFYQPQVARNYQAFFDMCIKLAALIVNDFSLPYNDKRRIKEWRVVQLVSQEKLEQSEIKSATPKPRGIMRSMLSHLKADLGKLGDLLGSEEICDYESWPKVDIKPTGDKLADSLKANAARYEKAKKYFSANIGIWRKIYEIVNRGGAFQAKGGAGVPANRAMASSMAERLKELDVQFTGGKISEEQYTKARTAISSGYRDPLADKCRSLPVDKFMDLIKPYPNIRIKKTTGTQTVVSGNKIRKKVKEKPRITPRFLPKDCIDKLVEYFENELSGFIDPTNEVEVPEKSFSGPQAPYGPDTRENKKEAAILSTARKHAVLDRRALLLDMGFISSSVNALDTYTGEGDSLEFINPFCEECGKPAEEFTKKMYDYHLTCENGHTWDGDLIGYGRLDQLLMTLNANYDFEKGQPLPSMPANLADYAALMKYNRVVAGYTVYIPQGGKLAGKIVGKLTDNIQKICNKYSVDPRELVEFNDEMAAKHGTPKLPIRRYDSIDELSRLQLDKSIHKYVAGIKENWGKKILPNESRSRFADAADEAQKETIKLIRAHDEELTMYAPKLPQSPMGSREETPADAYHKMLRDYMTVSKEGSVKPDEQVTKKGTKNVVRKIPRAPDPNKSSVTKSIQWYRLTPKEDVNAQKKLQEGFYKITDQILMKLRGFLTYVKTRPFLSELDKKRLSAGIGSIYKSVSSIIDEVENTSLTMDRDPSDPTGSVRYYYYMRGKCNSIFTIVNSRLMKEFGEGVFETAGNKRARENASIKGGSVDNNPNISGYAPGESFPGKRPYPPGMSEGKMVVLTSINECPDLNGTRGVIAHIDNDDKYPVVVRLFSNILGESYIRVSPSEFEIVMDVSSDNKSNRPVTTIDIIAEHIT